MSDYSELCATREQLRLAVSRAEAYRKRLDPATNNAALAASERRDAQLAKILTSYVETWNSRESPGSNSTQGESWRWQDTLHAIRRIKALFGVEEEKP